MRPGGRRAISQDRHGHEELMGAVHARLACLELPKPSRQDAAPGNQNDRHRKIILPADWPDARGT